jgi:hypothetical protein
MMLLVVGGMDGRDDQEDRRRAQKEDKPEVEALLLGLFRGSVGFSPPPRTSIARRGRHHLSRAAVVYAVADCPPLAGQSATTGLARRTPNSSSSLLTSLSHP